MLQQLPIFLAIVIMVASVQPASIDKILSVRPERQAMERSQTVPTVYVNGI